LLATEGLVTGLGPPDYADLKRLVATAGLLDKQPWFYVRSIAAKLILLGACLAALALVDNTGWRALIAVGLAVVSGQLGFQMHDAGHRQMFTRRGLNVAVGLLTANLLLGVSFGWWVEKHNRHHANPNNFDLDPDVDMPAIAYSVEQAEARRGVLRWVVQRQARLFFLLLTMLAWSMHVTSVRYLTAQPRKNRNLELGLLALYAVLWFAFLLHFVGLWPGFMVLVIQQCVGGVYLGSVFAPNHKGMLMVGPDDDLDFLRRQVLTSRNVRSNRLTDLWYGALNFQVEHHLFPTMARNRARAAHLIVKQFCVERGIRYHETSMLGSYREILGYLHAVGATVRARPVARAA
jgi:fatty acid desaturase